MYRSTLEFWNQLRSVDTSLGTSTKRLGKNWVSMRPWRFERCGEPEPKGISISFWSLAGAERQSLMNRDCFEGLWLAQLPRVFHIGLFIFLLHFHL